MQNRAQRILVVDVDDDVRTRLVDGLQRAGFVTSEATTAGQAREVMGSGGIDLVVSELALPDSSGLDLLRSASMPMILVAADADEADRVIGLELGADDFVSKPCAVREVVARTRAVLRRCRDERLSDEVVVDLTEDESVSFPDLRIDTVSREVTGGDTKLGLTRIEFDLLRWLAQHPRQVFSKAHLLREVWGCEQGWVNEATVTEHVRRVRRKLEDATGIAWIATVWGVGYRFEPPTTRPTSVHALPTAV